MAAANRHYSVSQLARARFRRLALRAFGRCQWCLRRLTAATATVDHVRPQSLGGAEGPENWCLSCAACNTRKDSRWRPGARPPHGPADWSQVEGVGGA